MIHDEFFFQKAFIIYSLFYTQMDLNNSFDNTRKFLKQQKFSFILTKIKILSHFNCSRNVNALATFSSS